MATYSEFVGGTRSAGTGGLIRDWANREDTVLSQGVITRCLDWAADECYRRLRIPTLELTRVFVVGETELDNDAQSYRGASVATIPVPSDFIELIQIYRERDARVFNFRVDNRSMEDGQHAKRYFSFTREENVFKLFGDIRTGDEISVHYYRRLPRLDATYTVNAANFNAQSSANQFLTLTTDATATPLWFASGTPNPPVPGTNTALTADPGSGVQYRFTGNEASHWLRDENERILLFGALMEVFNYLDEPETLQRYQVRFTNEIEELNAQERRRDSMGGNVQVSYDGGGLL